MKTDCIEFAQKYDMCQRFSPVSKVHPKELTSMTSAWPFAVWGIDLIGQLPKENVVFSILLWLSTTSLNGSKLKHSSPSHLPRSRSLSRRILFVNTEYFIPSY